MNGLKLKPDSDQHVFPLEKGELNVAEIRIARI